LRLRWAQRGVAGIKMRKNITLIHFTFDLRFLNNNSPYEPQNTA
jgi:hypothetical protein